MGRVAGLTFAPAASRAAIATLKYYPGTLESSTVLRSEYRLPLVRFLTLLLLLKSQLRLRKSIGFYQKEASTERYEKVIEVTNKPFVLTDIFRSALATTIDLEMTRVVDGDLVKIIAWYDNAWGFTNQNDQKDLITLAS